MTCIASVKTLVRDLLGCTCPDEVFDEIDLRWRGGGPRALELRVGNRLLVHLRWPADARAAEAALADWLDEGRATRDREGLNRFRLVLALAKQSGGVTELERRFDTLCKDDDRLHLHLLAPSELLGWVGH